MRWQVTAIATCSLLVAAGAQAQAAKDVPAVDADLVQEEKAQGNAENVDAGTGKTLQERIRAVSRRTFLKQGRFELNPECPNSGFVRRSTSSTPSPPSTPWSRSGPSSSRTSKHRSPHT